MENRTVPVKPLNSLLFAARITGIFWIVICLLIIIGYSLENYLKNGILIPYDDMFTILSVASLLCGLYGLVIANCYEGIGIIVSFSGFTLFIVFLILEPKLTFNPVSLLIFLPTMLYFVYWLEARKQLRKNKTAK